MKLSPTSSIYCLCILDEVVTNIKYTKTVVHKNVVININELMVLGAKDMKQLQKTLPNSEECKYRTNIASCLGDIGWTTFL